MKKMFGEIKPDIYLFSQMLGYEIYKICLK